MCSHPRSTREGAMETDLEFYTRRAREEREAADTAVSSEARESHQELAPRYDRMMRAGTAKGQRSEEHTSERQSLMRISSAVFGWKKTSKTTRLHLKTND